MRRWSSPSLVQAASGVFGDHFDLGHDFGQGGEEKRERGPGEREHRREKEKREKREKVFGGWVLYEDCLVISQKHGY